MDEVNHKSDDGCKVNHKNDNGYEFNHNHVLQGLMKKWISGSCGVGFAVAYTYNSRSSYFLVNFTIQNCNILMENILKAADLPARQREIRESRSASRSERERGRSENGEMGGFIIEKANGPLSEGELKIENLNPADNPLVTFNYFKEPEDLRKCVKGIRTIFKAVETKAYLDYKYANMTVKDIFDLNMKLQAYLPVRGNNSSALEQYCKSSVRTMWHYHGGCQIGKVVDDEYKVSGVDAYESSMDLLYSTLPGLIRKLVF
ncbi:hypothetical protein L1987_03454 [Smallanthus sonchifolius]|uniref:Uncharacterized protein n=1 Tax=Smallanthus sonchifolius TaxID=185202 RepID=A0ACB9KAN5_9ASTR|nr:hypothetical protein L1987_03454 [Smallanthus sonchifolius]